MHVFSNLVTFSINKWFYMEHNQIMNKIRYNYRKSLYWLSRKINKLMIYLHHLVKHEYIKLRVLKIK